MDKFLAFAVILTASAGALAQMPMPLLDAEQPVNYRQWEAAVPALHAALECRRVLDLADPALRPLLPAGRDNWTLIPPRNFAVFGLPVQSVAIYIDPDGELGASYTATVAAPLSFADVSVKSRQRHGRPTVGSLQVEQGERLSLSRVICTVPGTRAVE